MKKARCSSGFLSFWYDQACKPSSVVNSHLSWPDVAITAQCHLLGTRRADAWSPSAVLLRIGFAEPRGLPRAGELLPRLSILTVSGGISLLHFPWGCPRRPLAVIPALWSSDFPRARPFELCPQLFSLLATLILIYFYESVNL